MTRDRKKNLLLSMEQTVEELEREIAELRRNNNNKEVQVTPLTSPELEPEPAPKRQCQHGFSLSNNGGDFATT